jgi:hypothetical protein
MKINFNAFPMDGARLIEADMPRIGLERICNASKASKDMAEKICANLGTGLHLETASWLVTRHHDLSPVAYTTNFLFVEAKKEVYISVVSATPVYYDETNFQKMLDVFKLWFKFTCPGWNVVAWDRWNNLGDTFSLSRWAQDVFTKLDEEKIAQAHSNFEDQSGSAGKHYRITLFAKSNDPTGQAILHTPKAQIFVLVEAVDEPSKLMDWMNGKSALRAIRYDMLFLNEPMQTCFSIDSVRSTTVTMRSFIWDTDDWQKSLADLFDSFSKLANAGKQNLENVATNYNTQMKCIVNSAALYTGS